MFIILTTAESAPRSSTAAYGPYPNRADAIAAAKQIYQGYTWNEDREAWIDPDMLDEDGLVYWGMAWTVIKIETDLLAYDPQG
jgi:hypothetical protein